MERNLFKANIIQTSEEVIKEAIVKICFYNTVNNIDFRKAKICFQKQFYVITDPPYNQNYQYTTYRDNLDKADYSILLKEAFENMKSVIMHYPEQTINLLPSVTGTQCTQSVCWIYNSNTAKQSRLITWWKCEPNLRKVGQPYKNLNDKRIIKRIAEGKEAKLYDWWNIDQVKNVTKVRTGNPHPCPLPEEVARRIILTTTEVGDVIIDPFAGSGTILKVAKELGRIYIGFEIDKSYYNYMKSVGL